MSNALHLTGFAQSQRPIYDQNIFTVFFPRVPFVSECTQKESIRGEEMKNKQKYSRDSKIELPKRYRKNKK
jgi:hypothetical protein